MNERERDELIEAALTARRDRDLEGRVVPSASWWDLTDADREELFLRQIESREIEKALHPTGFSGTVVAVLAAIERMV
jgi:hypothetical protein